MLDYNFDDVTDEPSCNELFFWDKDEFGDINFFIFCSTCYKNLKENHCDLAKPVQMYVPQGLQAAIEFYDIEFTTPQ